MAGESAPYDYRNHYNTEREAEEEEEEREELKTRVNDLKNRIELRRMLSEYVSGALKPPIFYKDGIAAPEDFTQNDEVDTIEGIFDEQLPQPQNKRLVLPSQDNVVYANNYEEFPLKSLFREHQRPTVIEEDVEEYDPFDSRNNEPTVFHQRIFKENQPKVQSAVYTEGGLVYGPSATSTQHHKHRKSE